jgi:hypothetical protein
MKIRLLSVLLLLNFVVLLTPRDWWHHCDHNEGIDFSHSDTHFDDGSCDFCDFDLSVFTLHQPHFFASQKVSFFNIEKSPTSNFQQDSFSSFLLRGPPVNS